LSFTNLTDACQGCPGRCCTRRFWARVSLTKTEARNPLFKGKLTLDRDGSAALSMGKTACHFLDRRTGHCAIYEDRPMACRGYVCHTAGGYSTEVIDRFPALKAHLKRLGIRPAPRDCSHYYVHGVRGYQRFLKEIRDTRGTRNKDVYRYVVRTDRYELVGRFDRRGKFRRQPYAKS
jgi:Fe-S-cluster containining protein